MHPDGYVELRDRAKDIIISGGENISTIEVEQALSRHPAVLEVAVVGVPDDHWGERPKAFVVLKPGADAGAQELIDHVRARIARFKAPKAVEVLDELPKTSTGKVQKYELREREWAGEDGADQGLTPGRLRPPGTPPTSSRARPPPPRPGTARTRCG